MLAWCSTVYCDIQTNISLIHCAPTHAPYRPCCVLVRKCGVMACDGLLQISKWRLPQHEQLLPLYFSRSFLQKWLHETGLGFRPYDRPSIHITSDRIKIGLDGSSSLTGCNRVTRCNICNGERASAHQTLQYGPAYSRSDERVDECARTSMKEWSSTGRPIHQAPPIQRRPRLSANIALMLRRSISGEPALGIRAPWRLPPEKKKSIVL